MYRGFDMHPFGNCQAVAFEPDHLAGVIGQKADAGEPQVRQNLGAYAVVPKIVAKPQGLVGLDRIESFFLEGVGPEVY